MNNLLLIADVSGGSICAPNNLGPLFGLLGNVIIIFKIVVPILLIVFGMLDIGKSVVAGKPEEITKNLKSFAFRAIAAVLIFFIPGIVGIIMQAVADSGGEHANDWRECSTALKLSK